jgi:hypothetical protein
MELNLNRIVEIYKARMTVGLALMLGMVTVTGYGLSAKEPSLFLVGAFVPIFAFLCDFMIIYGIAVPFAYRAFVVDETPSDGEGIGRLFLSYASPEQERLDSIRGMEPGIERQRAFRRFYGLRKTWLKATIFALGTAGEVGLWFLMK